MRQAAKPLLMTARWAGDGGHVLGSTAMAKKVRPPWRSPPAQAIEDCKGPLAYRLSAVTAGATVRAEGPALVLALEGTVAAVRLESGRRLIDRSSWLWVPRGREVTLRATGALLKALMLSPAPSLLRRVVADYAGEINLAKLKAALQEERLLPRTVWVDEVAQRYLFERTVCRKRDNFVTWFCENELIKETYFLVLSATESSRRPSMLEREVPAVERAHRWLETNLFSTWTVAELAARVGMSARSLQRAFNAAYGMAPQTYARGRKLDAALLLLKSRAATVKEVAQRVGYSSTGAFSHAFDARFGQTPSQVMGGDTQ
jgi:AraC-like DNA-binding protein